LEIETTFKVTDFKNKTQKKMPSSRAIRSGGERGDLFNLTDCRVVYPSLCSG
jgi:hypothetical protein